ncbi:MAG: asparaginase [Campylobacterales bacterium]|nr:asparaginase [Campylobacterales bacterium]
MLILNCGGTFNKRYNPLNGALEVPYDNSAVEAILDSVNCKYNLAGIVYKDSLDMDADDRKTLANVIAESKESKFLIVHGTDTMDLSAEFLAEVFRDKTIVLTGAMKPYTIEKSEASLNLGMAIGFLEATDKKGVFICMSGYVASYESIRKNKDLGIFEIVR